MSTSFSRRLVNDHGCAVRRYSEPLVMMLTAYGDDER
jgi:hypothetical protein